MSQKKIDTAAIEQAATTISSINNQLVEILKDSRATVQSLGDVWSGKACEATISAYNAFESKYSQIYREKLDEYSKFLRNVAAANYEKTEAEGIKLADTI